MKSLERHIGLFLIGAGAGYMLALAFVTFAGLG